VGAAAPTDHDGAANHAPDHDHHRAADDHDGAADDHDGAANHDHLPRAGGPAGPAGAADDHDDDERVCVDDAPHPALTYTPRR